MDKYEYQVCLQEINSLIAEQDYPSAADIADTIDWKRVKSVITLCKISDLYKINGRYEEARELLLLAYDKNPTGRQIVSALCTLELKLDHYVSALKYYNTFVQIAPRDPERYILQYRLYQAQDVSLAEQTEVLENLKQADYRERWGYELAYLYYRQGDYASAIRECDELAATFGDGQYVAKARALKASMTGGSAVDPSMQRVPAAPQASQSFVPDNSYYSADAGNNADYSQGSYDQYDYGQDNYEQDNYSQDGYGQDEYGQDYYGQDNYDQGPYEDDGFSQAEDIQGDEGFAEDTRIYSAADEKEFAPGAVKVSPEKEPAAAEPEDSQGTAREEIKTDFQTQALRDAVMDGLKEISGQNGDGISEESSGQYKMVLDEAKKPEKQITGQMYLYGMSGWERRKNEIGQKFAEESRRRIRENTGSLFHTFEQTSRQGVLEELEQDLEREEREAAAESVIPEGMELSDGMTPQARYRTALAKGELELYEDGYDEYGDEYYSEQDEYYPEQDEYYSAQDEVPAEEPAEEPAGEYIAGEAAAAEAVAEPAEEQAAVLEQEVSEVSEPEAGQPGAQSEQTIVPEKEPDEKDDIDPDATRAWKGSDVRTLEEEAALQTAVSQSRRMQREEKLREERERRQSQQQMERAEIDRQKAEIERRMAELDRERAELLREKAEQERAFAREREELKKQAELQKQSGTQKPEEAQKQAEPSLDEEIRSSVEAESRQRLEDSKPIKLPEVIEETEEALADTAENVAGKIEETAEEVVEAVVAAPEAVAAVAEPVIPEAVAEAVETIAEETEEVIPEAAESVDFTGEEEANKVAELRQQVRAFRESYVPHELRNEEREMFAPFITDGRAAGQISYALDAMSLAAYTGNIIIAGASSESSMNLAKVLIRYMRSQDRNFSGKVAHSTGEVINRKDLIKALNSIENGALIVEGAGAMNVESLRDLYTGLDREDKGLLVILTDTTKRIAQMIGKMPEIEEPFNIRIDLSAMDNDALVSYATKYADASGYAIDDFGVLALHTRISEMQTIDHTVTVDEVRALVDEAISYAEKKTPGRLVGRMFGKRYDDSKRVILKEKDFLHNN